MRVAVLGAGVIGVATAYFLARAGAEVVVIDRQPGPAREASFANGGQISANHATPWATPSTPWKALRWLGRDEAPLLFHLRFDPALLRWGLLFLANCRQSRVAINIERALRVALYSRAQLAAVRTATAIAYDRLALGILHIFRNRRDYEEALPVLPIMAQLGCERRIVDVAECVAIEPALAAARDRLIGGIFSRDDESGDAHAFSVGLARVCGALGAKFRYGRAIRRLVGRDQRITALETDDGAKVAADAFVVALGSYTPLMLRPLGIRLPVYPAKGYSVTMPVGAGAVAPQVSLIDDEFKMVYSRLGDRLRVAGTAEFAGYDASVREPRARFLLAKAMELFPSCGDAEAASFWAGLRPSTPDGVPVLGATPFANLFLNAGHGTLGWTMACGAGRVVADLVLGRSPEIALDGLGLDRFG